MNKLPIFLFFGFIFSFFGQIGMAQEGLVDLTILQKELKGSNASMVSTSLKIINHDAENFTGRLSFLADDELRIIGNKNKDIAISGGDSLFVSVRALIFRDAIAGKKYNLKVNLINSEGKIITAKEITVAIVKTRKVQLFIPDTHILMRGHRGNIHIKVHLRNAGNTAQKIVLLTKLPYQIQENQLKQTRLKLQAFQDTTFVVSQEINREMMQLDNFDIVITGLYENGNVFSRKSVQINALKGSRTYRAPISENYLYSRRNTLFLRSQSYGEGNALYQGRLSTGFRMAQAEVNLNIDATFRPQRNDLYFRNTWIGYKTNTYGIRAGNIYKNYAINLHGRGVEAFLFGTNKKNRFEIGFIDKNYRLFENSGRAVGKSFWGAFHHDSEKRGMETTFIYDDDPLRNFQNMLISHQQHIVKRPNLKISAGLAGGTTNSLKGNSNLKYGGAASLSLVAKLGIVSFNSDNFVSTSYYPGRRRGALNLHERITVDLKSYRLFTFLNHYAYKPKYSLPTQGSENKFGMTHLEIGASRRFGQLQISAGPGYYSQNRNLFRDASPINAKLTALRFNFGVNYTSKDYRHALFFNSEIGTSNTQGLDTPAEFQAKLNLNYNWGFFRLNSTYQVGAFYLGEVMYRPMNSEEEKYERWHISPRLQHSFFNKKLLVSAGITYFYNTFSGKSLQITGRVKYQLPYNLEIFAGSNYYNYSFGNYANRRLEFGLIKHFRPISFEGDKNDLEIFVYKEKSGDDKYSKIDELAVNQLLYINGKAFKTNQKGAITYKNLPTGTYTISFPGITGWYAKDLQVPLLNDTKLEIGLKKMTTIMGEVKYKASQLSYEIDEKLVGLIIKVTDAMGNSFTTKTDAHGNFILFAPQGSYTISLIVPGKNEHIRVFNNNRKIQTSPGKSSIVDFDVFVKEKKVEYKKFTAN